MAKSTKTLPFLMSGKNFTNKLSNRLQCHFKWRIMVVSSIEQVFARQKERGIKMELTKVKIGRRSEFGSKAYLAQIEVGKWYKFDVVAVGEAQVGFGKVVEVLEDGYAMVEKYFRLPSYRPYAATKWFDKLPFAILG